jgi:hypothetical protein
LPTFLAQRPFLKDYFKEDDPEVVAAAYKGFHHEHPVGWPDEEKIDKSPGPLYAAGMASSVKCSSRTTRKNINNASFPCSILFR